MTKKSLNEAVNTIMASIGSEPMARNVIVAAVRGLVSENITGKQLGNAVDRRLVALTESGDLLRCDDAGKWVYFRPSVNRSAEPVAAPEQVLDSAAAAAGLSGGDLREAIDAADFSAAAACDVSDDERIHAETLSRIVSSALAGDPLPDELDEPGESCVGGRDAVAATGRVAIAAAAEIPEYLKAPPLRGSIPLTAPGAESSAYLCVPTELTVFDRSDTGTIYGDSATRLAVVNETAGFYVRVSQPDGSVGITPEEWPTLRAAVDQLMDVIKSQL